MEVNDKLYAPGRFTPGVEPRHSLVRKLGGPPEPIGSSEVRTFLGRRGVCEKSDETCLRCNSTRCNWGVVGM